MDAHAEITPSIALRKIGSTRWMYESTNRMGGGFSSGAFRTAQGAFHHARRLEWPLFAGDRPTVRVQIEVWSAEKEDYIRVSEYDIARAALYDHRVQVPRVKAPAHTH